jgi:hypothetical protein
MSGEMTIVTPGKISAGNWKQRDLPPPFCDVFHKTESSAENKARKSR